MEHLPETTRLAIDAEDIELLSAIWNLTLVSRGEGDLIRAEINQAVPKLSRSKGLPEVAPSFPAFTEYLRAEQTRRESNTLTDALAETMYSGTEREFDYLMRNYGNKWYLDLLRLFVVASKVDLTEQVRLFYERIEERFQSLGSSIQHVDVSNGDLDRNRLIEEYDEFSASFDEAWKWVASYAITNENRDILYFLGQKTGSANIAFEELVRMNFEAPFDFIQWILELGVDVDELQGTAAVALAAEKEDLARYFLRWDNDLNALLEVATSMYFVSILEEYIGVIPAAYEGVFFAGLILHQDYGMIDVMAEKASLKMFLRFLKYARSTGEKQIVSYSEAILGCETYI